MLLLQVPIFICMRELALKILNKNVWAHMSAVKYQYQIVYALNSSSFSALMKAAFSAKKCCIPLNFGV